MNQSNAATIFSLEQGDGPRTIRMTFAAAELYVFDIMQGPNQDYDDLIQELCHIGPIFMRLDGDLAEAYDNAFRTQPRPSDVQAVHDFRRAYTGRIKVIEGTLEGFE